MEVLEARRNDVLVLALKGRLDAVSAPSVRDHLQERIDQGERRFAVDAAGLTYISSSGLAPFAASRKAARRALRTDGAVCSPGARKACLENCRFYVAIQHFQLIGGSHSGLLARLTLFEQPRPAGLMPNVQSDDGHRNSGDQRSLRAVFKDCWPQRPQGSRYGCCRRFVIPRLKTRESHATGYSGLALSASLGVLRIELLQCNPIDSSFRGTKLGVVMVNTTLTEEDEGVWVVLSSSEVCG